MISLHACSRVHPQLSMAPKRLLHFSRDRVDRFALRAAIHMIDPIALVVAPQETSPHEIGNRPAHTRSTRADDPLLDLRSASLLKLSWIAWSVDRRHHFRAHRFHHRDAPAVTPSQGSQCLAKPIADGHPSLFRLDIGSKASVRLRLPRNQLQHQECIARPPGHSGDAIDEFRHLNASRCRRRRLGRGGLARLLEEISLIEHMRNLADADSL